MLEVYEPGMHIDHIVATQHGGDSGSDNLALACVHCNRHKGPNIAGIDRSTGGIVRLFHPRRDNWHDHFRWIGHELHGITRVGQVTIDVLSINAPDFAQMRAALMTEDTVGWQ